MVLGMRIKHCGFCISHFIKLGSKNLWGLLHRRLSSIDASAPWRPPLGQVAGFGWRMIEVCTIQFVSLAHPMDNISCSWYGLGELTV